MFVLQTSLFLVLVRPLSASVFTWTRDRAWENPLIWDKKSLPGVGDLVSITSGPISFSSDSVSFAVSQIDLAGKDAMLLLAPNSQMTFADKKNGGKSETYSLKAEKEDWFNPKNWRSALHEKIATDASKVPCPHDIVSFASTGPLEAPAFHVTLPENSAVNIAGFQIAKQALSEEQFQDFLASPAGKAMIRAGFFGISLTPADQVTRCQQFDGTCTCGNDRPDVMALICAARDKCPPTTCYSPLKASGDCCSFCGARITLQPSPSMPLSTIKGLVKNNQASYPSVSVHVFRQFDSQVQIKLEDGDMKPENAHAAALKISDILRTQGSLPVISKSGLTTASAQRHGRNLGTGTVWAISLLVIVIVAVFALIFHRSRRYGRGWEAYFAAVLDISRDTSDGISTLNHRVSELLLRRRRAESRTNLIEVAGDYHVEILGSEIIADPTIEEPVTIEPLPTTLGSGVQLIELPPTESEESVVEETIESPQEADEIEKLFGTGISTDDTKQEQEKKTDVS